MSDDQMNPMCYYISGLLLLVRLYVGARRDGVHAAPVEAAVAAASAVQVGDAIVEDQPHQRVLGAFASLFLGTNNTKSFI